jgi:hypothetical protein
MTSNAPGEKAAADAADRRPWGLAASLAWYVVVFEIAGQIYDLGMARSGLQAFIDRSYPLHVLGILIGWGITFFITVLAARLTRLSLRDYFGWVRPYPMSCSALRLLSVCTAHSAFFYFTPGTPQERSRTTALPLQPERRRGGSC